MKRIQLAIFAFLSVFAFAAHSAGEITVQTASSQFKQGQNQAALQSITTYLKDNPKDAQGRFLKGLILTELNRFPEAIRAFNDLTADYPDLPEPYNNLAVLYAAQGQYDQARNSLEMAIRTHPSYATAHENLGDIYAKMASLAYDKALQLDKSNQSAQTKLSMIKDLFSPTNPTTPAAVPTKVASKGNAKPGKSAGLSPTTINPDTPAAEISKTPAGKTPEKPQKPNPTNDKANIETAVQNWAKSWSSKDVPGYIASYSKDFAQPGMDRAKWETLRAERLSKPGEIKVTLFNLKVDVDGDKASARFKQRYESDRHSDWSRKTLSFERIDGNWKIVREQ